MQRYTLRDDQWAKIKNFLPGRKALAKHKGIACSDPKGGCWGKAIGQGKS